jgi:TolB-like protein/Tfp pilus assembly protein PilF
MPSPSLLQRLKERKLVQWALAYLAGAWVIYEGTGTAFETWDLPVLLVRSIHVLLVVGFFIVLVLAWYHGEKGRQRVSGPELLMVAALLVVAGVALSTLGGEPQVVQPAGEVASTAEILTQQPGIAVLPCENLSPYPEDAYFARAMHEEIIVKLRKISGLRSIGRESVEWYLDNPRPMREMAQELRVGFVGECSVRKDAEGNRVRVTFQLIDASTEGQISAENYDRDLTAGNLLDIESEIAQEVANQLDVELRGEERLRAAGRSTSDLEAYELYLQGVDRRGRFRGSYTEAIPFFQEAVDRDPRFVAAYAELAVGHARQYQVGGRRSEERAAAARTAAERALELDPESEDAQLAMGIYLYRVEKNFEAALDWLSRASGTLLGDYDYHYYRALAERRTGRWRQSLASLDGCVSLSPRHPYGWVETARTLLLMRQWADAEQAILEAQRLGFSALPEMARLTWGRDGTTDGYQTILERSPANNQAWGIAMHEGRYEEALAILPDLPEASSGQYSWVPKALREAETLEALGQHEAAREKYQEAAEVLEPLIEETPDDERYHASLGWAYAGLGMGDEAEREARRAVAIMPRDRDAVNGTHFLFDLAAVHARLGDVDEALEVLEDLLSAPSSFPPTVLEDHFRLRPIQDDPRFQALMDRERDRVF